ncbi:cobalamin-dependent protein [Paenibacillus mucilaginosus]|uniref:Cobalamin B12-binding domain-containing protein n=2 Tax=Paenibacillus mucilaginosus TaxID=61624 RepID=H6NS57_9BACL|nr:cobalamin-dependent protein [Paenibacillus mucilaginosus]AEI39052.1 cobalamin B12-binding domain-containing protein [Paenibacillus mucilaginosus KNP414]AFC27351.1 cobalamin B12-binding domain-containing protein [Paenibacillus mucilaginosus 3016]MCG7216184.1 cobalamin-dependent protein [Paenibacillus mucilaginosus]WDM28089.1 cobalamin-dependent protein [Paenibacillus mucilaginosus]WFA16261.1 cobalamin-binding protein [Paenibacillus mucilaginosus]
MPAHTEAGVLLLDMAEQLADQVTERQYSLQPDLIQRFGPAGRERTKQDTVFSLKYLAESLMMDSPSLFVHYITWLKALLEGYKVGVKEIEVNLACLREEVCLSIGGEHQEHVTRFLDIGLHQLALPADVPPFIAADAPYGAEAAEYLRILLEGRRQEASRLIMELVEAQTPLADIYLHIFQPVQYEIGRLWQTGGINVAQEHYCTAATQLIMSQLYPYLFGSERKDRRLVATCVGDEIHEVGLRMVADLFEAEGWDTYYLGANVPARSIIQTVISQQAHMVAISATMTYHVHLVKKLIEQIRASEGCRGVKIIVGGLPFNIDPQLWIQVGADGCSRNAGEAVRMAAGLLREIPAS